MFTKPLLYVKIDFGMTENQEDMISSSICIQPPSDSSCDSDGDSGDEECNDLIKLSRHQLLALPHLEIERPSRTETTKQQQSSIGVENVGKAVAACTSAGKTTSADASTSPSLRPDSLLQKRGNKTQLLGDIKICNKTEINKDGYISHQNLLHVKALYLSLNVF